MSLYDESLIALNQRMKDLQNQKDLLDAQLAEVNALLVPLNQKLSDKTAQLAEVETAIRNLTSNVQRLQAIITADEVAAAKGLPLPSLEV